MKVPLWIATKTCCRQKQKQQLCKKPAWQLVVFIASHTTLSVVIVRSSVGATETSGMLPDIWRIWTPAIVALHDCLEVSRSLYSVSTSHGGSNHKHILEPFTLSVRDQSDYPEVRIREILRLKDPILTSTRAYSRAAVFCGKLQYPLLRPWPWWTVIVIVSFLRVLYVRANLNKHLHMRRPSQTVQCPLLLPFLLVLIW